MRLLLRLPTLIIKLKKPWVQFIVELHLLLKGHNPVKKKSGFAIFMCKANVFRLRELGFTTFPVFSLCFPFSANLITVFSASQMVHSPKIFSKNLFEMLINLTSPKCPEVYAVNDPCSCAAQYIGTCSKKIQSEIIIQITTLRRATFKTWWLRLRKLTKVAHERETRHSHINYPSFSTSLQES